MPYKCTYCNKGIIDNLPAYCPVCDRPLTVIKPKTPVTKNNKCTWCKYEGYFTVPGNCPNCTTYLKGFLPK